MGLEKVMLNLVLSGMPVLPGSGSIDKMVGGVLSSGPPGGLSLTAQDKTIIIETINAAGSNFLVTNFT